MAVYSESSKTTSAPFETSVLCLQIFLVGVFVQPDKSLVQSTDPIFCTSSVEEVLDAYCPAHRRSSDAIVDLSVIRVQRSALFRRTTGRNTLWSQAWRL